MSVVWEEVGGDYANIDELSSIGIWLVEVHESVAIIQITHNISPFRCLSEVALCILGVKDRQK